MVNKDVYIYIIYTLVHTAKYFAHNGKKAIYRFMTRVDKHGLSVITGNGDCEVEPGLTELVLGEARVSSRIILVHRLDL